MKNNQETLGFVRAQSDERLLWSPPFSLPFISERRRLSLLQPYSLYQSVFPTFFDRGNVTSFLNHNVQTLLCIFY